MTRRDNLLRSVRFETPEYIPMTFHINPACWHYYPQDALHELVASHPFLFPDHVSGCGMVANYSAVQLAGQPHKDSWGCIWETTEDGITGVVTRHPLENWDAFDTFIPPDSEHSDGLDSIDWKEIDESMRRAGSSGQLKAGSLKHGHTFLTLCDLRGYENVLFDMVDHDARLFRLMQMVEDLNVGVVRRYLDLGVEWMSYPEDLGMQNGPMLSPSLFREYIKPIYQRLMQPAREEGCIVHMHSDGYIRDLVEDLIEGGVEVLNLQDLVNGIDWIADRFAGKVCIDLDIDRQVITHRGTPQQIDDLIKQEVEKIGSKKGGLMMIYGLYPGVPLENARVLMDAMERYAFYYS